MELDDIQLTTQALGPTPGLTFTVGNFGSTAASANAIISFYAGTAAGPTTLLQVLEFNAITFPAG